MPLITRLLFAVIGLAIILPYTSHGAEPTKANEEEFRKCQSFGPKACSSCR